MNDPDEPETTNITNTLRAEKLIAAGAWCLFDVRHPSLALLIQDDDKRKLESVTEHERLPLLHSLFRPDSIYAEIIDEWEQEA